MYNSPSSILSPPINCSRLSISIESTFKLFHPLPYSLSLSLFLCLSSLPLSLSRGFFPDPSNNAYACANEEANERILVNKDWIASIGGARGPRQTRDFRPAFDRAGCWPWTALRLGQRVHSFRKVILKGRKGVVDRSCIRFLIRRGMNENLGGGGYGVSLKIWRLKLVWSWFANCDTMFFYECGL